MHFHHALFSSYLHVAASVVALVCLLVAICTAPWRMVLAVPIRQHLLFGSICLLSLLWSMSITLDSGLTIHPMMMATAVLLLGASLAVAAGCLAALTMSLLGITDLASLGVDILSTVVVPALIVGLILRLSQRIRVARVFAYTLGAGFVGGMVSVFAAAVLTVLLLTASEQPELARAAIENAALLPLLMFPEGFINGTIVTALVVFHPEWVRTFSEPE